MARPRYLPRDRGDRFRSRPRDLERRSPDVGRALCFDPLTDEENGMAKKRTPLTFEKRRRELEKKQKRQEKLARKHERAEEGEGEGEEAPAEEVVETTDDMFEQALEAEREAKQRTKR